MSGGGGGGAIFANACPAALAVLFLLVAAAPEVQAARASGLDTEGDIALLEPSQLVHEGLLVRHQETKLNDSDAKFTVKLTPGKTGIWLDTNGIAYIVKPGTQADSLGIAVGDRLIAVDRELFAPGLWFRKRTGRQRYSVVIRRHELPLLKPIMNTIIFLSQVGSFVDVSGRLLYALMTSDESVRQDPHFHLASPVALVLFGVAAASTNSLWVYVNMMDSFTGVGSFFAIARTIVDIGLALGISRLRQAGQGGNFLRPVDMGLRENVVNVSLLAGCILMAGAVVASDMLLQGLSLTAYHLWVISRLNQAALFCSFGCAVTTAADVVGKELEELVQEDCDAADFTERIHYPIVEFMGKNRRDLSKCGLPLVLMTSAVAVDFMTYQWFAVESDCHWQGRGVGPSWCSWEDRLTLWVYLFHSMVHMAGVSFACGAAPLRISRAAATAQRKLTMLRSQRPHLHAQIYTVETAMAQENDGQGIGMTIEGIIVLNKPLIQKFVVTTVGAAALLMSFTDKLLGITEDPSDSLSTMSRRVDSLAGQMDILRRQAQNLSGNVADLRAFVMGVRSQG